MSTVEAMHAKSTRETSHSQSQRASRPRQMKGRHTQGPRPASRTGQLQYYYQQSHSLVWSVACHSEVQIRLTAVETAGPLNAVGVARSYGTANASRVTPHHLREVAPGIVVVRVIVRVLGLLFMPAMGGGASELDPLVVAGWSGLLRREVAARAHL